MASAPAGKFQDHYKIFGLDAKASTDEIHAAYTRQIELYHPQRGKEPSQEKYDAAQLAWEVLGNPEARKVFDSVRSGGDDEAEVTFSGWKFFDEMRNDVNYRNAILIALYDHKRQKPRTPAVTRRQLDMLIRMSEESVQMALWYLKDRGMVVVDDRSKIQITANGMDYLSAHLPSPELVAPFLKIRGEAEAPAAESAVAAATPSAPLESKPAPAPALASMPMTSLANLAGSLGASVQPAADSTPLADPPPPATLAPLGASPSLSVEPAKPRPLNIVRRPLQLKP